MLEALSVMVTLTMFLAIALIGASIYRKDWRIRLVIGICFIVPLVVSLLRLFGYGQSRGWIEGLLMSMCAFFIFRNFHEAKKLRALQNKQIGEE